MRILSSLFVCTMILLAAARCGEYLPTHDAKASVARAQQAWRGDWHAIWQVEWDNAPVRGPLVAEMWHADDGRMRIETLEAPTPALNGLILVDDGQTRWLYDAYRDARYNRLEAEAAELATIPLSSDAVDALDWLLLNADDATVVVSGRDNLESGSATRLDIVLPSGDRALLWIHDETGLPSRVKLHSAIWGQACFAARSISIPGHLHPGLFATPN
jgi:outer membrane lipoprotein-sorting protein